MSKTKDKQDEPLTLVQFPPCAVRLLLAEYARGLNKLGYFRLANSEDEEGTNNTWTVTRTDPTASNGKIDTPGFIRLTVERDRFARMKAHSDLRKLNGELALTIAKARGLERMHTSDPDEAQDNADTIKRLKASELDLRQRINEAQRVIDNPDVEDFYFPLDCPFKEFGLAPLPV